LNDSKSEFDVDHKAMHQALDYMMSNPLATTLNAAKKIARLCESEGGLLVMTFHDTPENSSTRYGTKYASLPVAWILLTNLSYFVIVLAGLFGFFSAERGILWWAVLSAFSSWIVVHAIFFGGGRFHFPLMPLFVVFAAQFLVEPKSRYRSMSRIQKSIAYSVLTILCTLWLTETYAIFLV
jgi:hypothetical protein